ncbi:MAG: hypothetical protein QXZ25_01945 [Candidatus Bathyarchaeia archaeon]
MDLRDYSVFFCAIFLIIVGLILTASGFGIFIVGRLDGFAILCLGLAMFWGGWTMSEAKGFPCAAAALLNIVDAASTVAFWNFEINPLVLTVGPTLFMIAKLMSSLAIMFYARFHGNPRRGGIALSVFFAFIVGWNLSQHLRAYFGLKTISYGVLLGTLFSFLASLITLYSIFVSGHIKKETLKLTTNKLIGIGLLCLLVFSIYLTWENGVLSSRYEELQKLYDDLAKKYGEIHQEMIFNRTLLMPKGLDEHYEEIRAKRRIEFAAKEDKGMLLFYVTQVLHDLGNYSYGGLCLEFNKTANMTCKQLTTNFAMRFLAYINKSYPSTNRIAQIYDWVNYFVSYVNDTREIERFPIETLVYRYGDDEDQAMALSFLLEFCGYETALCTITDGNLTEYGSEGFHHVFCAVRKDGFEYSGALIQLHEYPTYGKTWIVLDPIFGRSFGEEPEWMNNYHMDNGNICIPDGVLDCLLVDYDELIAGLTG